MKRNMLIVCLLWFVASSVCASVSSEDAKRFNEAAVVLRELRNVPDKGPPEDLLGKAQCVLVIPSLKKAAFIVGGEYGAGVMSCRQAGGWSAPVFMQLLKGSLGLQIGANEVDLVLLVMNREGLEKLLANKVSLGGDASVAAGPVGRSASAATDAQMSAEMLGYSRSRGVFAGIDVSGGVLKPDEEADARAYGPDARASDIVLGPKHVAPPSEANAFLRALRQEARATTGAK